MKLGITIYWKYQQVIDYEKEEGEPDNPVLLTKHTVYISKFVPKTIVLREKPVQEATAVSLLFKEKL